MLKRIFDKMRATIAKRSIKLAKMSKTKLREKNT